MVLQPRHQVGTQGIDVDAVERIKPHQQIILDRSRAAWAGRPVPQRGSALGGEGVDQFVGLARLHDLAALDIAPIAQPREFAIDLLVVGFPEEPDRRVERLGELIARHRTLCQACKDRVAERQSSILRLLLVLYLGFLTYA